MRYESSVTIDAPAQRVWEILTDTTSWPQWDPNCERIEGDGSVTGSRIKVFTRLKPGVGFRVQVQEVVPHQRLVWGAGMPFGLFKGERTFTLEPDGARTHFTTREVFSGPMLKLIGRSIPDLSRAFEQFTAGLKHRAELS